MHIYYSICLSYAPVLLRLPQLAAVLIYVCVVVFNSMCVGAYCIYYGIY